MSKTEANLRIFSKQYPPLAGTPNCWGIPGGYIRCNKSAWICNIHGISTVADTPEQAFFEIQKRAARALKVVG